jgi:hypothetical protein
MKYFAFVLFESTSYQAIMREREREISRREGNLNGILIHMC